MADTDVELVARVRQGDAAAFEALVRRHFRMAWIIAYARLGNPADAEDVCQDAFYRCWQRIADCRDPARVGAWIATVVRNHAHNRAEALHVRRASPIEHAGSVTAPQTSDAATHRAELRQQLLAALAQVSTAQREVVLLHDLEGLKHAEIAAQLGISEAMSRRHLSDARRRLRELLADLPTMDRDHD